MERRTSAILVFVVFFITFVLFLTCFGADYWADNDLLHSGVWKSCIKLTNQCFNNVDALDEIGKAGLARAIQALMCIALIVALGGGVANIFWIVEPDTPKIGIVTCVCIMVAGALLGFSVALYTMIYAQSVNALALLTRGGVGSSMPMGWAYYIALACTTIFEVLGILCCCCACQGGSNRGRVRQQPGYSGYPGGPGQCNDRMYMRNQGGMPPQNIDRGRYPPKTRNGNYHGQTIMDDGYGYPVPMDPTYPPPYSPQRDPPPYK